MSNVTALQATDAGELKPAESSLKGSAEKLISAVHDKNVDAVCEALREAFDSMEADEQE